MISKMSAVPVLSKHQPLRFGLLDPEPADPPPAHERMVLNAADEAAALLLKTMQTQPNTAKGVMAAKAILQAAVMIRASERGKSAVYAPIDFKFSDDGGYTPS